MDLYNIDKFKNCSKYTQMQYIENRIFSIIKDKYELLGFYIEQNNEMDFIFEIHMRDGNFYEIDILSNDSFFEIDKRMEHDFINERIEDLKYPDLNRNNLRYMRKYCE